MENGHITFGGDYYASLDNCLCLLGEYSTADISVLTLASDIALEGHTKSIDHLIEASLLKKYLSDYGRITASKEITKEFNAKLEGTKSGVKGILVGYGINNDCGTIDCGVDFKRRYREVSILPDYFCTGPATKNYNTYVSSFWCIGNPDDTSQDPVAMEGDSGGPLYLKATDGSLYLVGVIGGQHAEKNGTRGSASSVITHSDLLFPPSFILMVSKALNIHEAADLNEKSICVTGDFGSRAASTYFREHQMTYVPINSANLRQSADTFFAGQCDAFLLLEMYVADYTNKMQDFLVLSERIPIAQDSTVYAALAPPTPPIPLLPTEPMQRQGSLTSGNYSVSPSVSGGVHNMRDGPGIGHNLIVGIPARSSGVSLGECRDPDDGRSKNLWCRAEWNGYLGWVSRSGIVDPM